jgi:DNA-binding Xre family transcriptional regulator
VQTTPQQLEVERMGEAFAKALAVFFRELGLPSAAEAPPELRQRGVSRAEHGSPEWRTCRGGAEDEEFQRELAATIERHEALAKAGELETLEITGDVVAQEYATRLRAIIRARGMTQKALAEKLGVSPARISAVLKKPNKMKLDTLRRIADALGIGVREIV